LASELEVVGEISPSSLVYIEQCGAGSLYGYYVPDACGDGILGHILVAREGCVDQTLGADVLLLALDDTSAYGAEVRKE
jgi:hypothetical protein